MKVLVACEYSGIVRDAFTRRGHDAWSCDLLPSESDFSQKHVQCDVSYLLYPSQKWDLIIAHPDCTYLTAAGAWLFKSKHTRKIAPGVLTGADRTLARLKALEFVRMFLDYEHCDKICVENPVGSIGTRIRPADQYIHPYQFGDDVKKKTGLWLKGLPQLKPTKYIAPRKVGVMERWGNQTDSGQIRRSQSATRWKENARTYLGIAEAMASQWGEL